MKNSEFIRTKVPITKEEARAISLQKLDLARKKYLLDIGTGSGSISVEAGLNYPDLRILAVDKNPDAISLTRANIEKFGLENISLIGADLPNESHKLDGCSPSKFDSVFVGGASARIEDLVLWLRGRIEDGGTLVANFILIESMTRYIESIKEAGFDDIEVIQVSVSSMEKLGSGNYFKPNNPIFVVTAKR